jgi:hypothetical protein
MRIPTCRLGFIAGVTAAVVAAPSAVCGGQGTATPAPLPVLSHLAAPRHSGADLTARLQATADGRQLLAQAGLSAVGAVAPPATTSAASDWPAQFSITADATKASPMATTVGAHTVTTRFEHRGAIIDWDNTGQVVVTWYGNPTPPSSVSILDVGPLPAGWYVVGIDVNVGAAIAPGTRIRYSDPFSSGDCPLGQPDSQGTSTCVFLEHINVAVNRNPYLIGMNAGQGRLLGVTLSRATP